MADGGTREDAKGRGVHRVGGQDDEQVAVAREDLAALPDDRGGVRDVVSAGNV